MSGSVYDKWIATNVSDPFGTCQQWTWAMVETFPTLRPARGWYHEIGGPSHCHWWCVAPDGEIVDPTRHQFDLAGDYQEITDPNDLPTGACLGCGGPTFHGDQMCCGACAEEVAESFQRSVS